VSCPALGEGREQVSGRETVQGKKALQSTRRGGNDRCLGSRQHGVDGCGTRVEGKCDCARKRRAAVIGRKVNKDGERSPGKRPSEREGRSKVYRCPAGGWNPNRGNTKKKAKELRSRLEIYIQKMKGQGIQRLGRDTAPAQKKGNTP